jgi:hypothetical protein
MTINFARYWTRATASSTLPDGQTRTVTCRGWSNRSAADAADQARSRAQKLACASPESLKQRRYSYGDRPLPEPVIRTFGPSGDPDGVVTRNAYGALVLNTKSLLFADLDYPEKLPRKSKGILSAIFGGGETDFEAADALLLSSAESLCSRNLNLGFRVYRTKAGLRLICTTRPHEAASDESIRLLKELQCDPLYEKLCRSQKSFRARLSPKPWRIGLSAPPVSFPFVTTAEERELADWVEQYDSASASYAVCKFVRHIGNGQASSSLGELVTFHDSMTKALSELELA